jgi:serine/threonine protein kinase
LAKTHSGTVQTVTHNQSNSQGNLRELQASLDAYLDRNLEFSELRTRWITELAEKPEMRNGALRLLYQQPLNRHLTEERALSLKRIVETAIHDVPDDWTVVLDEDGDEKMLAAALREDVPAVQHLARPSAASPVRAAASPVKKELPGLVQRKPAVPPERRAEPAKAVPQSPVSVTKAKPRDMLAPGVVLSHRFVLEEALGRGGIGIVYKAHDRLRERANEGSALIALKVLREEYRSSPELRNALQREALQAQCLAHPNIVRVHDFHQDGDTCFLTMELLEGELLRDVFSRLEPAAVPTKRAMRIIAGMCSGLAHAHARGLVHADFKPGNVFLTAGDEPKILDFGFAGVAAGKSSLGADSTALRAITPAYASCNRLESGTPVISDDVYSLSCVIYELLTGRHPYDKKSALVARELKLEPKPIAGLTDIQWRTLATGLKPSRRDRTTEVHDLLEVFTEKAPARPLGAVSVIAPDARKIIVKKRSPGRAVFTIVAGILLGAAIVAGMVMLGIQPIPSKYVDLARESSVMQWAQAALGYPGRAPDAVIPELLPESAPESVPESQPKPGDMPLVTSADLSAPQPVESATVPVPDELAADVTQVPMTDTSIQESGAPLPSMAENQDPAMPADQAPEPNSLVVSDSAIPAVAVAPVFQLGAARYFIQEDGVALAVQIQRQGDLSTPASVEWSTFPGAADPQLDYAGANRQLVRFAAGEKTQVIFIPIVSDNSVEPDEDFQIVLGMPGGSVALGEPHVATAFIVDDDS